MRVLLVDGVSIGATSAADGVMSPKLGMPGFA